VNEAAPAAASGTLGALGGSLIALLMVVGLILALAWVLRRLPGGALRQHRDVRIVAQLAVGVRERVVVIAVGEAQLLLGVTSENVRLLHTLETPLPEQPTADFRSLLKRTRQEAES
jgi:flagellar protein FliO/FliZ